MNQTRAAQATFVSVGIATPAAVPQAIACDYAEQRCCRTAGERQFLRRVFANSGVQYRGSVLADAADPTLEAMRRFYPPPTSAEDRGPTTGQRMARYALEAPALAASASREALDAAGIDANRISHVICASCTGMISPGLDIELIQRLKLRPTVQRLQLSFMGCHAAFNALSAARSIVRGDADAHVLVCCTELCSLHLSYGFDRQRVIANALFADGAAAAIVAGQEARSARADLLDSASWIIPDSADAMGWTIGDHGFEMRLSEQLPELLRRHLAQWVEGLLRRHGLKAHDLAAAAIHPGGPKILDAVRDALGLDEALITPSRRVLAEQGNMSSPTVLFILRRLMEKGVSGPCLALGLGPGLAAEAMILGL